VDKTARGGDISASPDSGELGVRSGGATPPVAYYNLINGIAIKKLLRNAMMER
jgi:hypothetical protein